MVKLGLKLLSKERGDTIMMIGTSYMLENLFEQAYQ